MLCLLSNSSLQYFLRNANRIYTEMIHIIYLSVDCVHNIVLFVLVLICSNYQNMEPKKNLVINWRQQLLVVLNGSSLHEQWRMVLLVHWNVSCSFLHNHIFCDWLVSTVQWMLSRSSNWIIAIEDFPKRHLHVQS